MAKTVKIELVKTDKKERHDNLVEFKFGYLQPDISRTFSVLKITDKLELPENQVKIEVPSQRKLNKRVLKDLETYLQVFMTV